MREVLGIIKTKTGDHVADLGSGWGSLIIPLARAHPELRFTGYEASWLPWLFSLLLKRLHRLDNLTLKCGNFLHSDLSGHNTLLCYLYPGAMQRLAAKLEHDCAQDCHVISHTFALPGYRPIRKIHCGDLYHTPVYHYHVR